MDFSAARPQSDDPALLYSLSEVRELLFAAFDAVGANSVAEVGAEAGGFTEQLVRWAEERGGSFYSIEPFPTPAVRQLAESSAAMTLVEGFSQDVIGEMSPADVYLLDGDHNYFTVHHELAAIAQRAAEDGRFPLVIMQDVAWPAGHRDQYYAPEAIPQEARHPYTYGGVLPWAQETGGGGFRGEGRFAFADHEGGPSNGVLSALEDFLAESEEWTGLAVPCDFGLAVVFRSASPWIESLEGAIGWAVDNPILARLERNRLGLYLRVVALQDRLEQQRRDAANQIQALQAETDNLRARLEIQGTASA